jgi:hypothetical protein
VPILAKFERVLRESGKWCASGHCLFLWPLGKVTCCAIFGFNQIKFCNKHKLFFNQKIANFRSNLQAINQHIRTQLLMYKIDGSIFMALFYLLFTKVCVITLLYFFSSSLCKFVIQSNLCTTATLGT